MGGSEMRRMQEVVGGSPLWLHGWVSLHIYYMYNHYEIKCIMCMIFLLYQLR